MAFVSLLHTWAWAQCVEKYEKRRLMYKYAYNRVDDKMSVKIGDKINVCLLSI